MSINEELKSAKNKIPKLQILLRFKLRFLAMSHTWPGSLHTLCLHSQQMQLALPLELTLTCFLHHTSSLMLP